MADSEASTSSVNGDNVVSMVDVLAEEKQYEDDANAVLGGSDPNNCTYDKGYVPRQAVYSCTTCIKPGKDLAGICLACSLDCHDGHDLIELYTKRYFKCDCGNSKFGGLECQLFETRDPVNEKNLYNQNFSGKYCVCSRPYPDPEDTVEDDMIQCAACEDWFHGRHTGCDEMPEEYDEFICEGCCQKNKFLYAYASLNPKQNESEFITLKSTASDEKVEVEIKPSTSRGDNNVSAFASITDSLKRKSTEPHGLGDDECALKKLQANKIDETGGRFWPDGWRSKLCTCPVCVVMYHELGVQYLLCEDDTITAYELKGKSNDKGCYEQGMDALRGIDRNQQVEVLSGYADMKTQLTDYLKTFAETGKVVRKEDIQEFFAKLGSSKRQKTGLQHFCR